MLLEEIVEASVFEGRDFECKARLNRGDVEGWLKTIAGFANANGGDFYIGVEDKTNKLIGFNRKDADNERNYFNNQLNEHATPRPQASISFIPYKIHDTELYIIKVTVSESPVKPVILKFKQIPSIYMRREGFTNGATYEEIIKMSVQSSRTQYDSLDSTESYKADNFTKLFDFYAVHNDGKKLSEKALRSAGFYNKNGTLKNGGVLFEDNYDGEKTQVQCSVFSGFNRGSERIVTINKFKGGITDSIAFMTDFVKLRMNHTIVKKADGRDNLDSYPERALFEGIINAVAHRDYFLDGTQIQVDMFKDRLEISSPGSFYQGNVFGKTYDLSNLISKRRNELICTILVMCNVMEAAGTGFDKITEDYAGADENHKPYIFSSSDHFTLVLPDLTYSEGVIEENPESLEYPPIPNGTEHDGKVLAYCCNLAQSAGEIAKHLGLSDSTYFRKTVLENLVNNNYLLQIKQGRAVKYKTNTDVVRK